MERMNDTEWEMIPTSELPIANIDTEDHLQARSTVALPIRRRTAAEKASENHVRTLSRTLGGGLEVHLEPIWVAQVNDRLLVVDGHHRLHAYHAARRTTIPGRVRLMTMAQAVVQARRVNLRDRRLPLEPEQLTEVVWQELGRLSNRGTLPKELLPSCRKLAAEFGVSKSSAARMLSMLETIDLSQFPGSALDPWSQWPHWKYMHQMPDDPLSVDQKRARRILKAQRAVLKAIEPLAPDEAAEVYEGLIADDHRFAMMDEVGILPRFPEGPAVRAAEF